MASGCKASCRRPTAVEQQAASRAAFRLQPVVGGQVRLWRVGVQGCGVCVEQYLGVSVASPVVPLIAKLVCMHDLVLPRAPSLIFCWHGMSVG